MIFVDKYTTASGSTYEVKHIRTDTNETYVRRTKLGEAHEKRGTADKRRASDGLDGGWVRVSKVETCGDRLRIEYFEPDRVLITNWVVDHSRSDDL